MWGTLVKERVCNRFVGPNSKDRIDPDRNHLYFIYGATEIDRDPAWLWRPWNRALPD
ncbi:hypothetical protein [Breoghania sp.]|uniref:hypothetical protein n=1 Tax=Breoghania sp. TaxID=2065378 RepID=UPI0026356DB6|nr:hypothetical protein [Breoghania sp.]MDJ0933362.1 hypothetical protein [Breoghania sp.]